MIYLPIGSAYQVAHMLVTRPRPQIDTDSDIAMQ